VDRGGGLAIGLRVKEDMKGDIRLEIAVGVDLQLVARVRVNHGARLGRVRVDVQHEDRSTGVARTLKDEQVRDVGPRVWGVAVVCHA
jgi:hypothetical protein